MAERNIKKPLWIKHIGGGTIKLVGSNYRIKPNEEFRAWEEEIPLAGREQVKLLEAADGEEATTQEEAQKILEGEPEDNGEFYVEHRGGPWYDVKTPDGVKMNDKALKQITAENYRDELNGKEE